jgi:hypothetical protein
MPGDLGSSDALFDYFGSYRPAGHVAGERWADKKGEDESREEGTHRTILTNY